MGNSRSKQYIIWSNKNSNESVAYVSTMRTGKVIQAKEENGIGFDSNNITKVEIELVNANVNSIVTKEKIQGPSRDPYHIFAGMPDLFGQAPAVPYASDAKYFTFYVDADYYENNQIKTIKFYVEEEIVATFGLQNSISNRASGPTSLKF